MLDRKDLLKSNFAIKKYHQKILKQERNMPKNEYISAINSKNHDQMLQFMEETYEKIISQPKYFKGLNIAIAKRLKELKDQYNSHNLQLLIDELTKFGVCVEERSFDYLNRSLQRILPKHCRMRKQYRGDSMNYVHLTTNYDNPQRNVKIFAFSNLLEYDAEINSKRFAKDSIEYLKLSIETKKKVEERRAAN